jgi:predicted dehydrogenase
MIGCGNIGSRLLQSLVRMRPAESGGAVSIHVCEPAASAREQAAARAKEAAPDLGPEGSGVELAFHTDMQALESSQGRGLTADIALVTTTSSVRFQLASEAIERFRPKRLVFEKFLFPRRSEYALMHRILDDRRIEAWVHCSRNEAPGYHAIRALLSARTGPVHMTVAGGKFALASNAIHFLGLYNHLTGARAVSADSSGLTQADADNRRDGYCELTGDLWIRYSDGGTLAIIDHATAALPITIFISSPELTLVVDESGGTFRHRSGMPGALWQEGEMKMILASGLSQVFESIARGGGTTLPSYRQSAEDHLALIGAFNQVLAPDETDRDYCPIT